MKRKKSKRSKTYRKQSKRGKLIVYAIYLVLASLSFYFFFKSYQYISNIPEANNLTQEEIFNLTRIGEADIKLVRALKNDAFDSWLYEANDVKVKQLQKNQDTVLAIVEGTTEVSAIDDVITDLRESSEIIKDSDVEELYVLYYLKVLPRQYEKAKFALQEMTVEQPEEDYQTIFSLLDLLNKVYKQKGMLSVANAPIFKQAVNLIEEVNSNFVEVNQIKSLVIDHATLTNPIPEPVTRLGMELEDYVFKANDYLQSQLIVKEFEKKYSDLQTNLATNKLLIDNSVKLPDLTGLSVKQAQRELSKANLTYTIQGYTNETYKNGEKVPESQRGIEAWDDDKEDKILSQKPSHLEYDYIIEGSTIQLSVENKSIEKPIEPPESSSTSSSDSTSTSSSNNEETSDSTVSSSGF